MHSIGLRKICFCEIRSEKKKIVFGVAASMQFFFLWISSIYTKSCFEAIGYRYRMQLLCSLMAVRGRVMLVAAAIPGLPKNQFG